MSSSDDTRSNGIDDLRISIRMHSRSMSQIDDNNDTKSDDQSIDISFDSTHHHHYSNSNVRSNGDDFNHSANCIENDEIIGSLALISEKADYLVELKGKLNSRMKHACTDLNALYKSSSEMSVQYSSIKEEVAALPSLADWINATSSDIHQLKSQIQFLHNIMYDA